jgi:hypothetical protein
MSPMPKPLISAAKLDSVGSTKLAWGTAPQRRHLNAHGAAAQHDTTVTTVLPIPPQQTAGRLRHRAD